jgi:hypothetical protein
MTGGRVTEIKPESVELHIEELVLHGFGAGDRHAIAQAVEQELSRLLVAQFAAQGVPRSFAESSETPRLDAGAFNVASGTKSEVIGSQIAQIVHQGLTG